MHQTLKDHDVEPSGAIRTLFQTAGKWNWLQTRSPSFRDPIVLSGRSRHLVPKALSVSVATVRSWYFDPKTGRWRWPVNGADLVYPGIYLGDAWVAHWIEHDMVCFIFVFWDRFRKSFSHSTTCSYSLFHPYCSWWIPRIHSYHRVYRFDDEIHIIPIWFKEWEY